MCLLSSVEDSGYSCVCPTGHRLHPNGRDCLGELDINSCRVSFGGGGGSLATISPPQSLIFNFVIVNQCTL